MKKDPGLIFRGFLMFGDTCAIVFSFAFAYFIRTHLDQRPYYFDSSILDFTFTICLLIPIWLIVLAMLGLYRRTVFLVKPRVYELWRLLAASTIGVMFMITFDFFSQHNLFPVRIVAVYAALLCFASLWLIRTILRLIRRQIARKHHGTLRTVIIGNSKATDYLATYLSGAPESGYRLVGVVANSKYIPKDLQKHHYSSLKEALRQTKPDAIFQTDEHRTEYVYKQSVQRHLLYYFIPSEVALSSHIGQLELIGNTPAILVKVTPLADGAKIVKRLADLISASILLLFAFVPMFIIWLIIKVSEPKSPALYAEKRLSRYNQHFKIYKFRSMKTTYSGLTPEEAFKKMGKPELIKKYRKNGDYIQNDPRVTKFGKFIRAASLDELPQLLNVLKGDISLVGPRALVPGELRDYGDRSLLLSVKSGLTGLAQVSGRRNISFEERRALDIYYIQNWSLMLDIQIILRTIGTVFSGRGAK